MLQMLGNGGRQLVARLGRRGASCQSLDTGRAGAACHSLETGRAGAACQSLQLHTGRAAQVPVAREQQQSVAVSNKVG